MALAGKIDDEIKKTAQGSTVFQPGRKRMEEFPVPLRNGR
jgi:hypothetical protein